MPIRAIRLAYPARRLVLWFRSLRTGQAVRLSSPPAFSTNARTLSSGRRACPPSARDRPEDFRASFTYVTAMTLDGNFPQPDLVCDVLVAATRHDQRQNLPLARGQRFEPLLQLGNDFGSRPPLTVARDPRLNSVEQLLLVQRLRQE